MLDLLIIRHEEDSPPGTTVLWAEQNNVRYHVWNIATEARPFAATEIRALMICGGSMDTFEEALYPWLVAEKKFIKECVDLNKPVFGICLGSQLLAEVLGGRCYPSGVWEIGFHPIQLLNEKDSQGQPQTLQAFHWHQCRFELPPGAVLFATHEFCPPQGFTWGKNVIATQFHPETDEAWIRQCAEWVEEEPFQGRVQRKKEMLENISLRKAQQDWFFKTLTAWHPSTSLGK